MILGLSCIPRRGRCRSSFKAPIEPPTEDEQYKAIYGCEPEFQELVQAQRTDEAWVLLSNLAEDLLGIHFGHAGATCGSRSVNPAEWLDQPSVAMSLLLQALCRLSQRLNQLWQQP